MANETFKVTGSEVFTFSDRVAYKLLYIIFILAPIIAGIDKFFDKLIDWDMYVAPSLLKMIPFDSHIFLNIVGAIEILAGIIVAIIPKIGGFIVSAWLILIIVNLSLIPGYYDVALRDLGLAVAALALGLLSINHSCRAKAHKS